MRDELDDTLGLLATRVRALRKAHAPPFSQAELARRAGLSHRTLTALETQAWSPGLDALTRIARVLGVSLEKLFAGAPVAAASEKPKRSPALLAVSAAARRLEPRELRKVLDYIRLLEAARPAKGKR